jgi:membrane protease YdiL (CAAX protease family)
MNANVVAVPTSRLRPWSVALFTLLVLILIDHVHELLARLAAYRALYRAHEFYVPESIDKVAGFALCLLTVVLLSRANGFRGVSRELGLSAPVLRAFAFALVVSSPMWIGFAITRKLTPHIHVAPLLFLTVLSPFVEEVEFRGFGVRFLQRGTGWPFWLSVWPSALLTGFGHVEQGQTLAEMLGLFFLTAAGGVLFAWLVYRWQSLWIAIALHICMNLSWELFSVARSAIGGWLPFVFQNLTMLLAIVVTLLRTTSPGGSLEQPRADKPQLA